MRLRLMTVALATLFVSGCWWEGPIFYPPDGATEQPLTAGLYEGRSNDPKEKTEQFRITRFAEGGWGEAKDPGGWVYFVRLPGTTRQLWIAEWRATDLDKAGYGLMERSGDQWVVDWLIGCRGTQALVRAAGGTVSNDDPPGADGSPERPLSKGIVCSFPDRASLERALRAYAGLHPQLVGGTLKRIGD